MRLPGALVSTMSAAADTIYSNFRSMVCKASGKSCPTPSNGGDPQAGAPPASGQDPEAPDDGPSIGGGKPIDTIPGMGNGQGWSTEYEDGPFTVTADQTNSPCTIDGSGKPSVTLGASVDFNVGAGAGAKGKGAKVEASASLGDKTSYEVQTDPRTAGAIQQHQRPAPNPADPRSIPVGSSITMNRESYKGAKGAVADREIQVEMGYKSGHKVSSAVQRISDGKVRVTVGDSDLVENSVGVSAGPGAFKWGQTFDDGKARSVDLDVSTTAGRTAYTEFIKTGHLPQAGDAGASNPTTAVSTTDTSSGQAAVDFGNFGLSAGGQSVGYQNVETTHADGTKERNVFIRKGDSVMSTHYDLDGAGNIKGQSWALHVQDVQPDFINGLREHTGRSGKVDGPRDVSLTFGPNDTKALQDAALDRSWPPAGPRRPLRRRRHARADAGLPTRARRRRRPGRDGPGDHAAAGDRRREDARRRHPRLPQPVAGQRRAAPGAAGLLRRRHAGGAPQARARPQRAAAAGAHRPPGGLLGASPEEVGAWVRAAGHALSDGRRRSRKRTEGRADQRRCAACGFCDPCRRLDSTHARGCDETDATCGDPRAVTVRAALSIYIDAFAARSHAPVTKHARTAQREAADRGQTHAVARPRAARPLPSVRLSRPPAISGERAPGGADPSAQRQRQEARMNTLRRNYS